MTNIEFAILGTPTEAQRQCLIKSLEGLIESCSTRIQKNTKITNSVDLNKLFYTSLVVAVYFGNYELIHSEEVNKLLEFNHAVIPISQPMHDFRSSIPVILHDMFGFELQREGNPMEIAASMLESVGILRTEGKIFISYVQQESQPIAIQLFQKLTEKKFNVFLDIYSLRYGAKLLDTFSRNVIDSDLLIVLDTKGYKNSDATQKEFNIAKSRGITILRIVWPSNEKKEEEEGIIQIELDNTDLDENLITSEKIEKVVSFIQHTRCTSNAMQLDHIIDSVKTKVESTDGSVKTVYAHKFIEIITKNGKRKLIYPSIGFPSSNIMNEVNIHADSLDMTTCPILVYEPYGFTPFLTNQIDWLNGQLTSIDSVSLETLREHLEEMEA